MEPAPSTGLRRLMESFLRGQLSILLIIISLAAGSAALLITPREEEPQIDVPIADVLVTYPGGSAEEVEQMVASRLERMLYQIDGVEYVYSMSSPGMAVVTVRFYVGEDREDSLVKLYNKLEQNMDRVTPGISGWLVKPVEIDDVPIVSVALYSDRYGTHGLRRVAEEVADKLQPIRNTARITLHGGERRMVRVLLDPDRLAAYRLSALQVADALRASNAQLDSGRLERAGEVQAVVAGPFISSTEELRRILVGAHGDRPVYLRDVAEIVDGPGETTAYTRIGFGQAAESDLAGRRDFGAVTIAVAKKRGSNAVRVAGDIHRALAELRGSVIPDEIGVRVTRDYGATADDKVDNLILSLGQAVLTVIALIAFFMGWRTGLIVAIAVPITYSLTLLFNHLFGFTINRVTLFALILAMGLLVDDPIVGVENIYRHLKERSGDRLKIISEAMNEVMPPIILTTLAVIVAFLPMFFITGMMGPYMKPMAFNVPLAVIMSTVVALTITPWVSSKLLNISRDPDQPFDLASTGACRGYRRLVAPFITSRGRGGLLLGGVALLFAGALMLAATGRVPLKMLPFDNKNEVQVLVDMPESATLEQTDAVVRELESFLLAQNEVTDVSAFVGTASPMDFNGMVRKYYLREGTHVADLRINLLHRTERSMSSHAMMLRMRDDLEAIGVRHGANLKLVEMPPGPPVLSTVVAEIYGRPHHSYADLQAAAIRVREAFAAESGVVDVDSTVEAKLTEWFFRVDREKAALNGISTAEVAQSLRLALSGEPTGVVHLPTEQNELEIVLRLPRALRSDPARLERLPLMGREGQMVQLGELGGFERRVRDQTIYHKNQGRVVYVTAEMAGRGPAYAVFGIQKALRENPLPPGIRVDWLGEGEWKITVDVFRDLGIAFSAALLMIYVLLVYQTGSFALPGVIMLSIPLTMIGIMPGFWLLNLLVDRPVGGYADPVFFTATAMIGMIALSGIVIRNAVILIEFTQQRLREGAAMFDAIVEAGAVRLRPIFLTAGTTVLGAWPITLDPIFSGLAWAIIFGMFVSTAFTLVVVPVVFAMLYTNKPRPIPVAGEDAT